MPSITTSFVFVDVQSLSHVRLFVTPWTAACQASLSCTISWSLTPKLMSIESGMLSSQPPVLLNTILAKCIVIENEQRQCKYVKRTYKVIYFQIINYVSRKFNYSNKRLTWLDTR